MVTRVEMLKGFPENMIVCEAGVRKGTYAKYLISDWLNPLELYLIDKEHYKNVDKLIKNKPNVKYYVDFFENSVNKLPTLDMVYIDGLHDYNSVINDLRLFDKITSRWIAGHDYIHEGDYDFKTYHDFKVREAVETFVKENNYFLTFITTDLSNRDHDPDAKGGKNKLYSYVISKTKSDNDLFLDNLERWKNK